MRKERLTTHVICLALLLFSLDQRGQGQSTADLSRKLELLKAYPDLILVNGKIHTMDEPLTEVQAMAVKNHRILALGTDAAIRFLAGPNTEVLDLKGRPVLPGMIDVHTHPNMWAVMPLLGTQGDFYSKKYNDPQLKIVFALGNSQMDVLRELERLARQRAQEVGPGKWIWIALFGGKSIPESNRILNGLLPREGGIGGTITPEFLDTIAPNNPLSIFQTGPNNTKAREIMEKVSITGREENDYSQPNIVFYDILMRNRVDEAADFAKQSFLTWAASGFTTFGDQYYGSPTIMKVNNRLYQKGEMPIRWGFYLGNLLGMSENLEKWRFLYRNLGDFRGIGNDYIWNAGVANEAWDEGDNRCTRAKPLPTNTSFRFAPDCSTIDQRKAGGYQNVKAALESGLRLSFIHAGRSDGTYDALFTMLDEEIAEGRMTLDEVRALRISTDHNDMIRPDQISHIAKYGIRVGFRGWMSMDSNMRRFLDGYGERYIQWMTPTKSVVNAGGHPYFGGDLWLGKVPYYAQQARDYPPEWSGNIWAFIEFFVTRTAPGGTIYNRNESIDRVTLMRMFTNWGAESLLREKEIGSLEVGKLADFIVLDKDIFTIPDEQIHTIRTLLTAVGGKTVYKAANY